MFTTLRNHISAIYKKDYKRDLANYKTISLLNLDYKIYTNSFELNAKKRLATIVGEHQSEDFKNRIILLLYS